MSVPIEYLQLRDALRDHPDYAQIPNDDKKSCALFMHMTKDIDEGRPVGESSLAKMYGLALSEAHRFQKTGRLAGIKLPEASAAQTKSKGNNKQAALAVALAVTAALGDAPAPVVNTTTNANDDPAPETPDATPEPTTAAANDAVQVQEPTATTEPARPSDDPPQNPAALAIRHAAEVVDDDPASEISRLHGEIAAAYGMSLDRAIRIGQRLTQQKESLGHGKFLPWVHDHLPFDERTARRYMQLWEHRAELKSDSVSDLTTAYRLTAPKTKPKADKRTANGKGTKTKDKQTDNDATKKTNKDESATGERTDDDQTQDDDKPKEKPASTHVQDEQTSSTGTDDNTSSSTKAQETDASSNTKASRTSEHERDNREQANTKQDDTTSQATSTTTTGTKPPPITFKEAFPVVLNVVIKKDDDFAREVIDRIARLKAITLWMESGDREADRARLLQVLREVFNAEPRPGTEEDGTASWAREIRDLAQYKIDEIEPDGSDEDGERDDDSTEYE